MRTKKAAETIEVNDDIVLSPSEAQDILVGVYLAGTFKRTPQLCGPPGCGKTSVVKAAAATLRGLIDPNFGYVEINPTMPADEVGGIPDLIRVEGQVTRTDYAMPKWYPTKALNPDWKGIICLDDALQGDRLMQQVLANLIHARNLRSHELPDGAMVVVTGNRVEDKAGVTKTLTHFADRMYRINVEGDADSWIDNFALPNGLDERVIGHILMDKSKLNAFDPNLPKCPTSRTWEAVSNHLKFIDSLNAPDKVAKRTKYAQAVLAGELGMGEAVKFWAYCNMRDQLPDIDGLLKDPKGASINYPMDVQMALAIAIANRVDGSTLASGLEYIDRYGPDLTTVAVKLATKRDPSLKSEPAFVDWAKKNANIIHAFI